MQRTDERESSTADFSVDADLDGRSDPSEVSRSPSASSGGRSGSLFSPKLFLGVLLASFLGAFVGGAIPLVGIFGRLAGLFAVGFGVGLLASERRYLEVGLAGALASAVLLVLSTLTTVLSPFAPYVVNLFAEYGLVIAGAGAGAGLLASAVGHYFGRDLRDGLTREI